MATTAAFHSFHLSTPMIAESPVRTKVQPVPAGVRLQSAMVTAVKGNEVRLNLPDSIGWATVASTGSYEIAVGDQVLAMRSDVGCYVLGVIAGKGKTRVFSPKDIRLCAPHGSMRVSCRDGIHLRSHAISVIAEKLEITALNLRVQCESVRRRVVHAYKRRVGRLRIRARGTSTLNAREIVKNADGNVVLDGRKIHLN